MAIKLVCRRRLRRSMLKLITTTMMMTTTKNNLMRMQSNRNRYIIREMTNPAPGGFYREPSTKADRRLPWERDRPWLGLACFTSSSDLLFCCAALEERGFGPIKKSIFFFFRDPIPCYGPFFRRITRSKPSRNFIVIVYRRLRPRWLGHVFWLTIGQDGCAVTDWIDPFIRTSHKFNWPIYIIYHWQPWLILFTRIIQFCSLILYFFSRYRYIYISSHHGLKKVESAFRLFHIIRRFSYLYIPYLP